jgi:ADP-ribosyl-[dinitrogen reductase] hydrolase
MQTPSVEVQLSSMNGIAIDPQSSRVAGCLIGQAIGDMMGLPYENLSPRRIARLARFDRPTFLFGYGCGSDDTEHAGMTAEAIRYANGDVAVFQRRLTSSMRRWFLTGPPGIGLATLKACLKLCLGFPVSRSGVPSAGNGPAMRAAILGVMVSPEKLAEFVTASTRLTHTDRRAEVGSLIIARLAAEAVRLNPAQGAAWISEIMEEFKDDADLEPLRKNMQLAAEALGRGLSVPAFADQLMSGRGVSGFIAHTVPVAVMAFFRHADDYAQGIEQVIRAGGDTDTTAAITGALIGSRVGMEGIPLRWRQRHFDWPWSLDRLLHFRRPSLALWPIMVLRNLGFFLIVMIHLSRRLLPPW